MIKIVINRERCKACGLCIAHCPKGQLNLSAEMNKVGYHPVEWSDDGTCTGCGFCALMCPEAGIEIYRIQEKTTQDE